MMKVIITTIWKGWQTWSQWGWEPFGRIAIKLFCTNFGDSLDFPVSTNTKLTLVVWSKMCWQLWWNLLTPFYEYYVFTRKKWGIYYPDWSTICNKCFLNVHISLACSQPVYLTHNYICWGGCFVFCFSGGPAPNELPIKMNQILRNVLSNCL